MLCLPEVGDLTDICKLSIGKGSGVVSSEPPDVILGMVLDVVSGVVSVSDEG